MKNEFSNFRSAIEWPASSYEDGLDADGYPIAPEPWRKPYIRGDESEAGDFKPASIGIGMSEGGGKGGERKIPALMARLAKKGLDIKELDVRANEPIRALLIECDGRDYHSTAEQRMHDWQKDANAHDRGYLTVRFTGSQINRNADSCARKIFDMVMA